MEQCSSKTTWTEKARFQSEEESSQSLYPGSHRTSNTVRSLTADFDPVGFPLTEEHAKAIELMLNVVEPMWQLLRNPGIWNQIITDYEQHNEIGWEHTKFVCGAVLFPGIGPNELCGMCMQHIRRSGTWASGES